MSEALGAFGFVIGSAAVVTTNVLCKMPPTQRPWVHLIWGSVIGWTFYSIPRWEASLSKEYENFSRAFARKQSRSDAAYAKFQARVAQADQLMAADPQFLSRSSSHHDDEHSLKFYKRY